MSSDDLATAGADTAAALVPEGTPGVEVPANLHVVDAPASSPPAERPRLARLPIEALGDVELKVEVVLGRARLRLQELLDVRPGQAVELDRARNSPVDVLVNGTLFARGEIVVIDDTNLGVHISEVVGSDMTREVQ